MWGAALHDGWPAAKPAANAAQGQVYRHRYSSINDLGANVGTGTKGTGACTGTVKSFVGITGYGFITDANGVDHYVHESDCGCQRLPVGASVTYDVADNPAKPGTTKAVNVTGGTAPLHDGKGKGKDTGGYGPMFGGVGGSPYDMYMMQMMGGAAMGSMGGKPGKGWGGGKSKAAGGFRPF
eukprot:gnl/TRDRNA2_/TRDRNA2_171601_c0_seq1.p1 gnl/TRDRNA2_/TRDRNA2_171601_c0~~gnl/TRDRNA2_/TRDRNA2_171601_c0_seq1.p1  ORF type:complete len:206 (+),score=39.85 gnl/TRDRNA2_/TRDRNA2_171601_c0_seq1:77-619(+)